MANYGFGITAAQINKLIGGEWSDDVRINCFMAASIAELPDAKAYAKFVALLNGLGIKSADHVKIAKDQYVDTYTFGGAAIAKLSEDDMRKVVAAKFWKDQDPNKTFRMLMAVTGKDLIDLYETNTKKDDDAKFVLHRIVIGQSTVYRICPDTNDVPAIVAEAIRYLAKDK
jgi:hypothetical protein